MDLRVEALTKSYEANRALDRVSFEGRGGQVVAVCGENGAGKSTLINILSGAIQPDEGAVYFDGTATAVANPQDAIALGIHTVHQELSLLPHLSVAENILLGQMPTRGITWLIDWDRAFARAEQVLADFGFPAIDVRQSVAKLSVSLQQIVEIAKAIATPPRVLILDEPTAVLSVAETDLLFKKIKQLTASGTLVIYISHRLAEVFRIADRVVVLRDGGCTLAAEIATIDEPALIKAMVGRSLEAIYPQRETVAGEPVLEVRGLAAAGRFQDIGFVLKAGEITGLFGLVGSGRTEVARVIFGADPKEVGDILIDGKPVAIGSPGDAVRHGLAFVTEDRKRDGLALDCTMLDNGALASLGKDGRWGLIDRGAQMTRVDAKLLELAIRPRDLAMKVRRLSGGNQQKVVLAKWMLAQGVRVFIFDEPTRGVDVGAKVEIYRLIADIAHAGVAVLLISSELPEVLGMSDRLLVMREGRLVAELPRAEFSMETAFAHAAGVGQKRSA